MRRTMNPLIVFAFVLVSPIWIPAALAARAVGRYNLRRVSQHTRCQSCGATLGSASLRLADEEWAEGMRRLQEQEPGVRHRLHRLIDAICARCGAMYRYGSADRTFVPVETTPPALVSRTEPGR
jgi:hypothetical protein